MFFLLLPPKENQRKVTAVPFDKLREQIGG
jgi:hypothetical protein